MWTVATVVAICITIILLLIAGLVVVLLLVPMFFFWEDMYVPNLRRHRYEEVFEDVFTGKKVPISQRKSKEEILTEDLT